MNTSTVSRTINDKNEADSIEPAKVVSTSISVNYALPVTSALMLLTPLGIVQAIYAKHYGIALSTLAVIVLLSRIVDAISDPIIGYCSDRYRRKHGTRKPFIVTGAILLLVCGYFLYVPLEQVSVSYFLFWFVAFYIAYTLFEIPHISWPCDITGQSLYRAKLYSFRVISGYIGVVFFYCVPFLPIFPTQEITLQTLKVFFFIAAGLMLPCLFQCMRQVPAGAKLSQDVRQSGWHFIKMSLLEMAENVPFLIFTAAFVLGGFAAGMWSGLIYIYVDSYLGMSDRFAQIFLTAFMASILVSPIWYQLAARWGKKLVWGIVVILLVASFISTGILSPEKTSFTQLLLVVVVSICASMGGAIMSSALLSEIVDYSHLKVGIEKSATYFSMKVFFEKTAVALGGALALAVVSWHGFSMTESHYSSESIQGLKFAIAWAPAFLMSIALVFVVLTPIDERRHRIIRKRLDSHLRRV